MNFKSYFNKAIKFLNPAVPVGALEITDSSIRYLLLADTPQVIALRLEPGVVQDGVIKNEADFKNVLKNLHSRISGDGKAPSVIVTIRSSLFYAQVFSLPPLPKEKISDAIDLNLAAISPLKVGESYSDAEPIGRGPTGESEYLGAFAPKVLINKYVEIFREAGFAPVALEFSGLSVARAIREFSGHDIGLPAIVVQINASGADFFVLKEGRLVFQYLSSWENLLEDAGGRQIGLEAFLSFLSREVSRVANFYSGKWGGSAGNIILASEGFPEEARAMFQNMGFEVADAGLSSYRELGLSWLASLGAAKRGLLSRKEDIFISLAPVGTEAEFAKNRLLHFIRFWRNAVATTLAFLLISFIAVDSYLARINARLENDLKFGIAPELQKEITALEAEAKEFNRVAGLAAVAKASSQAWSPILAELRRVAGSRVVLRRIFMGESSLLITGRAPSELAAITFKNSLSQSPFFKEVNLPLANLTPDPSGGVSFQMTIALK